MLGLQVLRTGSWNLKDIQNSHQNRSKNKLVREKTLTRAHGSCSLRLMGSWNRLLPQKQLEDFYTKVILPSVTYGLTVWGSCNKTHLNNLEKLHARAGRIVYGLPWDTSTEDVLMRTGWDSLETMYKLRLTEFVFKCLKGYTVTEFKDLLLQRNSGRRRNENIILPRRETNFVRNSIRFRGAIAQNTLTNKETRALKEFKRCLVKFDTDKMHFEPILASSKNRDITDYFSQF